MIMRIIMHMYMLINMIMRITLMHIRMLINMSMPIIMYVLMHINISMHFFA